MTKKIKNNENLTLRPPVVVIMGHVDSGKTSILDSIRKTRVAAKETGGITQHIGAYQIENPRQARDDFSSGGRKITFIDTPGHEAFSAMRSRGAKVADIAVLVVDSAKGVEPQTKEAILHIKKAKIPLIVALNKIDMPGVNLVKTKGELAKEDVLVESMGGKVPSVETSVPTGKGIDDLLNMIILVAEMEDLKSDPTAPIEGAVIESHLDGKKGITASMILTQGILKIGEVIGTASAFGKIKNIADFQGDPIRQALPSDPIIVFGFEGMPKVGENFKAFPDLETAENNISAEARFQKKETEFPKIGPDQKILNLILKTDCLGSSEAIEGILKEIPQEKVMLRILKSEAGDIDDGDVKMAKSGKAKIFGFKTKTNPVAGSIAERENVRIANFEIIYELVEEVKRLMEREVIGTIGRINLGKMRVLANFLEEKGRQVIGGRVLEGTVERSSQIEVIRNEEIIGRGKLVNLQKNKKEADRVEKGQECGILYEGSGKIEKEDLLVFFKEEKIKGEL